MQHIPVLLEEVVHGLQLKSGSVVVDATLGLGGHAKALLDVIGTRGKLYGFDRDERNLTLARERLAGYENAMLIHDSYAHMNAHGIAGADAVLFDLGFSSLHVDDAERGFSFQNDGPLDMRYDTRQGLTAEMIVNGWSKDDLATLFRRFGDESFAHQIAKAIFDARRKERITRTAQLADIIASVKRRQGKVHPATNVFQALRIAVNDELGQLEHGLKAAVEILAPHGRFAVITFHSLEDKIVKEFINEHSQLERMTKKPIVPTREEVLQNPRARSAKLRIAQKGGYDAQHTQTFTSDYERA